MLNLPDEPARNEVLTFISKAASYGNLGLFIGSGFSKAVLGDKALSWGELLEGAAAELGIDYGSITKVGVSYPDIASAVCSAHADATDGLRFGQL